jgi:hypothetical protein
MRSRRALWASAPAVVPASLANSQGTPARNTPRRLTVWVPERWQRRRRDKRASTQDRTAVLVVSHHPDTSARVGVSPNPPKLPRHLFEARQDSEDPSFGVYD